MTPCTAEGVRQFILNRYAEALITRDLELEAVPDNFDLLTEGVIDSLGLLQLINALEDHFEVEVDFDRLDPEEITVIGPFCSHVAQYAALHSEERA